MTTPSQPSNPTPRPHVLIIDAAEQEIGLREGAQQRRPQGEQEKREVGDDRNRLLAATRQG